MAPADGDGLRAAAGPWGPPARALRCSAQAGQPQADRLTGLTSEADQKVPASMPVDRGRVGRVSCRMRWLSFRCRLPLPWQGENMAEPPT